jgi:hypothetical protein
VTFTRRYRRPGPSDDHRIRAVTVTAPGRTVTVTGSDRLGFGTPVERLAESAPGLGHWQAWDQAPTAGVTRDRRDRLRLSLRGLPVPDRDLHWPGRTGRH